MYKLDIRLHLEAAFIILIGSLIYILFRPKNIVAFLYIHKFGWNEFVDSARSIFEDVSLSNWFLYSLPDGLWSYATLVTILIIFRRTPYLKVFGGTTAAMLIFSEAIQHWIPRIGTFDPIDLSFVTLGVLLAYVRLFFLNKKEKEVSTK